MHMSSTNTTINMKDEKVALENLGDVEDGESVSNRTHIVKLEKQVVRRLDIVVMPTVIVLYLLAYIDRANIGNARLVRCPLETFSRYLLTCVHVGWSSKRPPHDRFTVQDG